MDLKQLRYFIAVAEEGSLTRAAERLGLQQPPLGQQIRNLEASLRVELFKRRPRALALNPAGVFFLAEARAVVARADAAAEAVRRFAKGDSGNIRLGFTSSASMHRLTPELLRRFHAAYPMAEVSVVEHETYELVLGLRDGSLDVALIHVPVDRYPDLVGQVLSREEMVAALPRDHPLAAEQGPIALERLLDEKFIIYRRADGHGLFDDIASVLIARGQSLRAGIEVRRLIAALNLVAAHRGVTIVPATMTLIHSDAIVYRTLLPGDLPLLPLFLVHRRDINLKIVNSFVSVSETLVDVPRV